MITLFLIREQRSIYENTKESNLLWGIKHVEERAKRSGHTNRPRHAHGRTVPALLAASAASGRTHRAGRRTGASATAIGAHDGVPRFGRQARAHRRILCAPWRVALVRPQRGRRHTLPVSRLEVRHERSVPRRAF